MTDTNQETQFPLRPSTTFTNGRTCILVLGMHRSGTSALTRMLSLLGAALPRHLLGPGLGNETGHWEPERIVALHDRFLIEAGSSWDDWRALDTTQMTFPRRRDFAAETLALMSSEFGDAPLVLVKDPRICRFAPTFISTLAEAEIDTQVVLAIRNPIEVARSLKQRDGMLATDAALLWLRHVLDAEAATRHLPRAVISYESLLTDWSSTLTRISDVLRVAWPFRPGDIVKQATRFLDPGQRHHKYVADELLQNQEMRGWVADAYHALQVLEDNPESKSALADLDRVRSEFNHATPILALHVAALRCSSSASLKELRNSFDQQLRSEADAANVATTQLRSEVEAARDEAEKLLRDAQTARAEAEQIRCDFETRLSETEQLRRDFEAACAVAERMRSEVEIALTEARQRSEALAGQLANRESALKAATTELSTARNTLQLLASMGLSNAARTTHLERELQSIRSSRSWAITQPLRTTATLARAARSVPLRKLPGVAIQLARSRIAKRASSRQELPASSSDNPTELRLKGALIVTPPHTLHYATILAAELMKLGFRPAVEATLKRAPDYQHIFIFCPNVFDNIPDDYIAIQMEQTVSSRWLTPDYIQKLSRARAVIDYSVDNIQFFRGLGLPLYRLFYVPVPSRIEETATTSEGIDKQEATSLLFYGDTNCERRKRLLSSISANFPLKVINNTFGPDLWRELRQARAVVNVHYYENALLETARLSECMSFGVPVISEDSVDDHACREFDAGALFVERGSELALVEGVRKVIEDDDFRTKLASGAKSVANARLVDFTRHFRRALLALDMIGLDDAFAEYTLKADAKRLCLTLSETPERTMSFVRRNRDEFSLVNGFRHRIGWKGCALSYKAIMMKAIEVGHDQILVCEDDASFPPEYDNRLEVVQRYLANRKGEWDIFSGFMADIKHDFAVSRVEHYEGIEFVWLDRCISTVFNIYSERAMKILAEWDPTDGDVDNNTIDRYLQRHRLSVVLARPFLVGHDESATSTVWGFKNTQYGEMVDSSINALETLVMQHREQTDK